MLVIEVLGPGCANCRKLEQLAREALASLNADAQVVKVTDVGSIAVRGVMRTPGLVVDGKLVSSGRIPAKEDIVRWIEAALGEPAKP